MLLMLIGALAVAWVLAIVVVVALCAMAAQADRAQARPIHGRRPAAQPAKRAGLSLIA